MNIQKPKIMIFRKDGGRLYREKWEWNRKEIDKVKEYKYLEFYSERKKNSSNLEGNNYSMKEAKEKQTNGHDKGRDIMIEKGL